MIKDLFEIAGDRKPQLIQGTILYTIASLFEAAPYIFLYLILDGLFAETLDLKRAVWLFSTLGICILLQGIFLYWANRQIYITSFRLIGDLRLQLGNHIRKLPMGFFNNRQIGDLNGLVSNDMTKIESIPSWVYPKIVSAIATSIFIALFLLAIDWRLTLATLAGVPLALFIYVKGQKLLQQLTEIEKRAVVEANSRIIEYIQGIAVIKAFNQTGAKFNKLENALNDYKEANLGLSTKLVVPAMVFAGVLDLGFVLIIFVGTYLLFDGELTVSTLLLFLVVALRFYAPLYSLFEFSALTRMMNAALGRVREVLNTPPLTEPDLPSEELQKFDIEFERVSFAYEETPVLQDLSFHVPEKTITALVGASGSGKTTITNLIARFWDTTAGEIFIGGVNIKHLPTDRLLSNISMVFQNVYLFNDTILNNIKFGKADASFEAAVEAAKAAQCHEFIIQLPQGYNTIVGEGGATLSGGEKQRIAIARAILKDAPIVLLDEATASVDPENEILLQQAINSLVESKTLIIIAHQLATITKAQQILVIDDGRIVQRGKHEELVADSNGKYHQLWASRQKARSWKLAQPDLSTIKN
ncbi:ABC transporter HlyB/MsbA family protein [Hyella patelloides LEGE 07179]|uniref:ABC transporter HlyB/MsbA family protein n=1 Tax=Hyella patelloides LEGE 07179 TaxID=945734 RepID=A0A563W1P2_9CYAN|nr:ABC transporter ATP-binding protein [Hyella patelloides]VEP17547.1 ABC transporter HlyB/MsbA family protein [Hyella patelloides LEGE 07179]